MADQLAFALINPYSIAKSRTGGIIGRFISRTGLDLVAARMFGPSVELTQRFAELLRAQANTESEVRDILADYVLQNYGPHPETGRRRRVMMLLFAGENAIERVYQATGPLRPNSDSGETIRDTFGDFIRNPDGSPRYVEPAVLVGTSPDSTRDTLRLWAEYSERDGGLIADAADLPNQADVERTLVLIKPDNFRFPSARPGNIIDLFSRSGLRIIGAKVHHMSVEEAEQFYGPVRDVLRRKLVRIAGERALRALSTEFNMTFTEELRDALGALVGPYYGEQQFYEIVRFMTGWWPPDCPQDQRSRPGRERCLALVYSGVNAVETIRNILGPTDPNQAQPGQVRREFGRDIMVNAAHASDSRANAEREMRILRIEEDTIRPWVKRYFP